jgi:predicted nucleic acid-binding Zn ribbon protein
MSDDPLANCTTCGATVQRVFHPVAVHFKGSGFYNTDYGKQKRGGGSSESKSESSTSTSSSDSGSKSESKKAESKTSSSSD